MSDSHTNPNQAELDRLTVSAGHASTARHQIQIALILLEHAVKNIEFARAVDAEHLACAPNDLRVVMTELRRQSKRLRRHSDQTKWVIAKIQKGEWRNGEPKP